MPSFVMESFANVDGRGFQEPRCTAHSWSGLLQGSPQGIYSKLFQLLMDRLLFCIFTNQEHSITVQRKTEEIA